MKRTIFLLILFSLILSACGGGDVRDLSTPSSRLVGHWKSKTVIGIEKFFSEVNPDTDEGTYTEYEPGNGTVSIMTYKIENEAPEGERLTILAISPDGTELPQEEFVLKKDGQHAQMLGYYFEYIDGMTGLNPSEIKPTYTPSIPIYEIVKDTGLYETASADSEMQAVLLVGHRLTPRNGEAEPTCKDVDAGGGMIITSCYMESLSTGRSGWVIRKWMTRIQ